MKNRIREFRKQAGLTQEELADRVEVSRQTINSLEKGRYDPSILLAYRISGIFGKIIEEVFIFQETNERSIP